MRNRITEGFRTFDAAVNSGGGSVGWNLIDTNTPGLGLFVSGRSQGATQIDTVTGFSPAQNQRWSVLSVGFLAYLCLVAQNFDSTDVTPAFGQLGKVVAGVSLDSSPQQTILTSGGISLPFVVPVQRLINDQSLTTTLFDPSVDSLPPYVGTPAKPAPADGSLLAIRGSILPPDPLKMMPGVQLSVGLWITPSLLGTSSVSSGPFPALAVRNASYVINYDDGS